MKTTRLALAIVVGCLVSSGAIAHSELASATWCASGTVMHTGGFSFTTEQLDAELQRRHRLAASADCVGDQSRPNPASGSVGTCGVFDPPFEVAYSMARTACGAASSGPPTNDSPVVAFVVEPASFNDANHHETFNFEAGLSGMCGYCVMQSAPPPRIGAPIAAPIGNR